MLNFSKKWTSLPNDAYRPMLIYHTECNFGKMKVERSIEIVDGIDVTEDDGIEKDHIENDPFDDDQIEEGQIHRVHEYKCESCGKSFSQADH